MVSGRRDYYPSYYREKRRKERIFLVTSLLVALVIVVGLSAFVIAYLVRVFKNPVSLEEMVPSQTQPAGKAIEEQRRLSESSPPRRFVVEERLVTLSDIEGYSQSFPEISVRLEGVSSEAQLPKEPSSAEEPESVSPRVEEEKVETEPDTPASPPQPLEKVEKEKAELKEKKRPAQKDSSPADKSEKTTGVSDSEGKEEGPRGTTKASLPYVYSVFAGVVRAGKDEVAKAEAQVRQMGDRLLELGLKPTVIKREQGDEIVFQVQVGASFDRYELAESLKQKLKESGFENAYILRRSG